MPCYNPEYSNSGPEYIIDDTRVNQLTALLCKACNMLNKNDLISEDSELLSWWTSHCKVDKKRIAADKKKAKEALKEAETRLKQAQSALQQVEEEENEINSRPPPRRATKKKKK